MTWVLEVFKMFIYVSFPVGLFHYFNRPQYFEEMVIREKEKHFPPVSKKAVMELENFIREYNAIHEKKHIEVPVYEND